MSAKPKRRVALAGALLLAAANLIAQQASSTAVQTEPNLPQLLVNPDLELPVQPNGLPPGWFKAAMPGMTQQLEMTLEVENVAERKEQFLQLRQKGVPPNLYNNWAQRIENPPAGGKFRLEVELATVDAQEPGAAPMIVFATSDKMIGMLKPENSPAIHGTSPWKKVTLEGTFPPGCTLAIVRFGLEAGCEGTLKIRKPRLYLLSKPGAGEVVATPAPPAPEPGMELLQNGDFSQVVNNDPAGWFRAMLPNMAIEHRAGIEEAQGRGNVVFVEQKGTKGQLVNNWAQRLEVVPAGATVELTVDVKTLDVPENTGVVMIQCWGDSAGSEDGVLLSAATTQSVDPIGGTRDWRPVKLTLTVPEKTSAIIVRCGMFQSGKIWFDNASLKVIVAPTRETGETGAPTGGFRITGESMAKLERARGVAEKLQAEAQRELGDTAKIRKEILARSDGRIDIVFSLDF